MKTVELALPSTMSDKDRASEITTILAAAIIRMHTTQGDSKLDETNITQALRKIDVACPQFTAQTRAQTIFSVVDRVNVFPDKLGIKFNLPAVLKLIQ